MSLIRKHGAVLQAWACCHLQVPSIFTGLGKFRPSPHRVAWSYS